MSHGHSIKAYCLKEVDLESELVRLPELLLSEHAKTIKLEKKVRVARVHLRISGTVKSVYIKQRNVLSIWRQLASVFQKSAALRSLFGANFLLERGFATARPIAAVEYRACGLLIKSFYLAEEIAGAKNATNFWREDLLPARGRQGHLQRRDMLRGLALLFRSLHARNIYHNDLKASNILVLDSVSTCERTFNLIDLQGLSICRYISARRRIKNLAQLNRSLGEQLTRTEKLVFLKTYLGDRFGGAKNRRDFVRRVIEETRRQIARERLRHPVVEPLSSLETTDCQIEANPLQLQPDQF